jgi:hypothetical protein
VSARGFVIALLVFFAVLSVKYSLKVLDNRSAIRRWQPQVLELQHGVDLSQRYNYPNPPIMAVLLEPLVKLPPLAAALTWFYLKVALTLLALRWIFQMVEEGDQPMPAWARALAVLLALKPIVDDLNHGNINLFILFLIVASLTAYRKGRDLLAGVVMALAIACKVTPALFLPYLVWKRAWRTLAGCVVGLGLFLWPGVVPALRLGFEDNQRQLLSWYTGMVHPFIVEGKVTSEHNNQSLPGLVARLATHNPSFATWVNNVYTPTRYDNLVELTPAQARWLVKGCMGLFALLVVWTCRRGMAGGRGWRMAAEFSLILLGMLLFSERTWKHHCVTLALPFAVICGYLGREQSSRLLKAYLIGSLTVVMLLLFITGIGPARDEVGGHGPVHPSVAKLAQVYGAYVFAYLILGAVLVVLLRRQREPAEGAQVVAPVAFPR